MFNRSGRGWRVGLLAWVGLVSLALLRAESMIPLSPAELAARAEVVIHGKVLSKTCQRRGNQRLCTVVELGVDEVWKGVVQGNRFQLVQAGGVLGDLRVGMTGQPDYRPGEEVVVFARLNDRGEGVTIGLAQGKFEVWQAAAGGPKYARNPFYGQPGGAGVATPAARADGAGGLSLATLKHWVRGGAR